MGFDLNGINPVIKSEAPENKEDYEALQRWYKDNPGIYFRNNVWWWRPLWDFVCSNCDDILTEEDMNHGCFNDNHKISETKAKKIAKRLYALIEDKTVEDYELVYEEYRKKKAESDDKEESFMGNYPFCQDNIAKFAKFCKESGGFVIS